MRDVTARIGRLHCQSEFLHSVNLARFHTLLAATYISKTKTISNFVSFGAVLKAESKAFFHRAAGALAGLSSIHHSQALWATAVTAINQLRMREATANGQVDL